MTYFNCHAHTEYSNIRLLDCINKPKALIDTAISLGLSGIAITDHECLSAHMEVNQYAKEIKEKYPNFKIALGNEIYLVDERIRNIPYYHFILIAKDALGHKALRELSSTAWINSYVDRRMERVPTLKSELTEIVNKYKGHLIATSACLGGEVSSLIIKYLDAQDNFHKVEADDYYEQIKNFLSYCQNLFGNDFYLECQPATSKEQIKANKMLYELSKEYNISLTVGTDAHYLLKKDRFIHKAYLNSKGGEREVDSFYEFTYLMDADECKELLSKSISEEEIDTLFQNTLDLQNKIQDYDLKKHQNIPEVEVKNYPKSYSCFDNHLSEKAKLLNETWPNLNRLLFSDNIQERYWINQCLEALDKKNLWSIPYIDRLEEEARVKTIIGDKLNTCMFAYPNTLQHYINLFWDCGSTVGAGRGCFKPDSNVLLASGKVKPIQEIQIGDKVFSKEGHVQKVEAVLEYDCNEELFTIVPETDTAHPFTCTNNHELWAMRGGVCGVDRIKCSKHCKRKCAAKKASFTKQWIRADELTINDYIFYPRPNFPQKAIFKIDLSNYLSPSDNYIITKDYITPPHDKTLKLKRYIPIDKDFLYVLGVCIGDGWTLCSAGDKEHRKNNLGIAFNSTTEKDLISLQKCENYFINLGFKPSQVKHKEKNVIQLQIYSKPLAKLYRELIGQYSENKQIPKEMLYNNFDEMLSLLEGLLASDGSYDKKALRISYDSINYNLICQVKLLMAYLGIYGSIVTRPASGNCQTSYKLRAGGYQLNRFINKLPLLYKTPSKVQTKLIVEEEGFYFQIKNIITEWYKGKVYDLTVQNDHSYIINNVAVHNSSCSALNHFLLGITQLDPIKWNLPFFRYLNEDRTEIGDIDLDLAPSRLPEIFKRIRQERGELGLIQVCTFGTENTKSCVLSSCRGYRSKEYPDGIDVDEAQYISSLVPIERGFSYSLKDLMYGDIDRGRLPNKAFIKEVSKFPGLIDVMFGIENLICRRGIHASGVILFDEDIYDSAAVMKAPNGALTTQWDLHQQELAGSVKYDFLLTSVQDIIIQTIKLLQEDNILEKDLTLREIYDKYLSPEVIPQDDPKMWEALANNKVLCCFQFDSAVGAQAAKKIQPKTPLEMADANGLMRLMPSEPGAEMPLDKYVRFKKNINLWYKEMRDFGLTPKEQKTLEPYFKQSYGVPPSQEQLMTMLMDENICNFSLAEANEARKIVGKKVMSKIPQLKEKVLTRASSFRLGEYVWKYGAGPQMGYSFSIIHALAYSFIGMQTLYLATHFNPIYWNTACIIVNSGSLEDNSEEEIIDIYEPEGQDLSEGTTFIDLPDKKAKIRKTVSTDYAKIAKAIGDTRAAGINISLVNINESSFSFKPDVKNNRILYGLKGMLNIGDDFIQEIIAGRPYTSPKDFYQRISPKRQAMVALIKGGAFDEMCERRWLMAWYIWKTCDKKSNLNLQNLPSIIKYGLLPEDTAERVLARRVYEFNRYLKAISKGKCEKTHYLLDTRAINFIMELNYDNLIQSDNTIIAKEWDKVYQKYMDVFRNWISTNKEEILDKLNFKIFQEDWIKYAGEKGKDNYSAWEMETLCFYYHEHEMKNVNFAKYGCMDFFKMPEEPIVERTFPTKDGKEIRIYELKRICGTCIAKNKNKGTIALLTTSGVVNVRFRKEYFALFDKQISARGTDNKKHVIEKSWFNRGSMIMITGMRQGDDFVAKKYNHTAGHTLYKITAITSDGDLILQTERAKGELEDEN